MRYYDTCTSKLEKVTKYSVIKFIAEGHLKGEYQKQGSCFW